MRVEGEPSAAWAYAGEMNTAIPVEMSGLGFGGHQAHHSQSVILTGLFSAETS
jgi:hypothetical protein